MDKIFSGCVELELDKVGRMLLPQSWFEAVGRDRHVFVMPDPAVKCLRLVPASNMEARLAKMRERAIIDPAMNRALQVIGENAEQIEVDNEGCIDISAKGHEFKSRPSDHLKPQFQPIKSRVRRVLRRFIFRSV